MSRLGFGFIEVGSTTPKPQPGNEMPRVFRIPQDRAIINRYGFNSDGHEKMIENLTKQAKKILENNIVVGVNLGKNRDQINDIPNDYIEGNYN